MLTRELNLKETTPTTLDALVNSFGRSGWFNAFSRMRNGAMVEIDENGKKSPRSGQRGSLGERERRQRDGGGGAASAS